MDALYLSGWAEPPASLLADLATAKAEAQADHQPVKFDLGGEAVMVEPFGFKYYPYVLRHRLGFVGLRAKGALPAVNVQPLAEALHGEGPGKVVSAFESMLDGPLGGARYTVNRLDVFADFQGWSLHPSMESRFVGRYRHSKIHKELGLCTSLQFGSRKPKTYFARIYDKTVEVAAKGGTWVPELLWAERMAPGEAVHRVEFQVGTNGLHDLQIRTPAEVLAAVGDVWRYCTHDWLTLRVPSADRTKKRWDLDPAWVSIQAASQLQEVLGLSRVRRVQKAAQLDRLTPVLVGCLTSLGAILGRSTLRATMDALPMLVLQYETRRGVRFDELVAAKRKLWGLK